MSSPQKHREDPEGCFPTKEAEEPLPDPEEVIKSMKMIKMGMELMESIDDHILQLLASSPQEVAEEGASGGHSDTFSDQQRRRMQIERRNATEGFEERKKILSEGAKKSFGADKKDLEGRLQKIREDLESMNSQMEEIEEIEKLAESLRK